MIRPVTVFSCYFVHFVNVWTNTKFQIYQIRYRVVSGQPKIYTVAERNESSRRYCFDKN